MATGKRRVHITGGKGFLGGGVHAALDPFYDVSISDIDDMDVTNRASIEKHLRRVQPDVMVHLAGLMGAQRSKQTPGDYFQVNSMGTLNLLEAMRALKICNLIFFSSLTVHGPNTSAVDKKSEESEFNPAHPYATSKVVAEYMIRDFSKHCGIKSVVLRPSIVTGNFNGEPNALLDFCRQAAAGATITIYGDGRHEREFVSQKDISLAVKKAVDYMLELSPSDPVCEAFEISSGLPISMSRLAERCIELARGGRVEFVDKQTQAFSLTADIRKAAKILGWVPRDDIDSQIQDALIRLREMQS